MWLSIAREVEGERGAGRSFEEVERTIRRRCR